MPQISQKPFIRARNGGIYPRELRQRERVITIALALALGERRDNATLRKLFLQNEKRIRFAALYEADKARGNPLPWKSENPAPLRKANGELAVQGAESGAGYDGL